MIFKLIKKIPVYNDGQIKLDLVRIGCKEINEDTIVIFRTTKVLIHILLVSVVLNIALIIGVGQ